MREKGSGGERMMEEGRAGKGRGRRDMDIEGGGEANQLYSCDPSDARVFRAK